MNAIQQINPINIISTYIFEYANRIISDFKNRTTPYVLNIIPVIGGLLIVSLFKTGIYEFIDFLVKFLTTILLGIFTILIILFKDQLCESLLRNFRQLIFLNDRNLEEDLDIVIVRNLEIQDDIVLVNLNTLENEETVNQLVKIELDFVEIDQDSVLILFE